MLKALSLAASGVLLGALVGCTADVAPLAADPDLGAEQAAPTAKTFEVTLRGEMTTESVVSAIVAAGREELAAACAAMPEMTIRIMNPLASGAFEDRLCTTLLSSEGTAEASEAFVSAEHIGHAQQKSIITSVACFTAATTAFIGTSYGICPHGKTEKIRTDCNNWGGWGGVGLGFVCGLSLAFPF